MNTFRKILITGATGFIGTRLCERMALVYRLPYRALVRNFTHANRIARMNAELVPGDLLDRSSLHRALTGCDAVVHLAHSEDATALRETKNLLAACAHAGLTRFVHISSIAVHGTSPTPADGSERTATIRRRSSDPYCAAKAATELAVQKAVRRHRLPAVILRPTIVYGPYSPFVVQVIRSARQGEVVLIDEGKWVCNAVYVDDVCDAIERALQASEAALGKAFFINADQPVTWADFTTTFANMVSPPPVFRSVSSAESLARAASDHGSFGSNARAFVRLLASPAFHHQLATVPWLGLCLRWAKNTLARHLSETTIRDLKNRLCSPGQPSSTASFPWPAKSRVIRETCPVFFSNNRAKQELGWRPRYTFAEGAKLTYTWLDFARLLIAP